MGASLVRVRVPDIDGSTWTEGEATALEGVQVLLAAGRLRGTWVLRPREEVEGSEMSIGSMTTGDLAAMVAELARVRYYRSNSCSSGVSVEVWLGTEERGLGGGVGGQRRFWRGFYH